MIGEYIDALTLKEMGDLLKYFTFSLMLLLMLVVYLIGKIKTKDDANSLLLRTTGETLEHTRKEYLNEIAVLTSKITELEVDKARAKARAREMIAEINRVNKKNDDLDELNHKSLQTINTLSERLNLTQENFNKEFIATLMVEYRDEFILTLSQCKANLERSADPRVIEGSLRIREFIIDLFNYLECIAPGDYTLPDTVYIPFSLVSYVEDTQISLTYEDSADA